MIKENIDLIKELKQSKISDQKLVFRLIEFLEENSDTFLGPSDDFANNLLEHLLIEDS